MQQQKGFTIIELIVVIAIIAVLAAIVITNVNGYMAKARDSRRAADIRNIQVALAMYYASNGNYPASGGATSPNGSWSNSNDSSWTTLATALNPYVSSLHKDPNQSSSDWPGGTGYSYAYFSLGYGCSQQWYMLVYKPEISGRPSPGVTACDGTYFNYSGTITIGVGK